MDSISTEKPCPLFEAYEDLPSPSYKENLNKLFDEELIAETSYKEIRSVSDLVEEQNWDNLKKSTLLQK